MGKIMNKQKKNNNIYQIYLVKTKNNKLKNNVTKRLKKMRYWKIKNLKLWKKILTLKKYKNKSKIITKNLLPNKTSRFF